MTRRSFVVGVAGWAGSKPASAAPRSKLGIATTSFMTVARPKDTLEFLEKCHQLGAAGIQAPVSSHEPSYLRRLREKAEAYGMYLEVMAPFPRQETDGFERAVRAAVELGAAAVRIGALAGRRYENFKTLAEWKQFVAESKAGISKAVPIAEKWRMPLAIENHKDWTLDELLAILQQYDSPYFGCLLDTGNNIALLDDPWEVIEKLAPYALSTHIKDMGVAEAGDGFLLSEVVLGEGMLDVRRMISTIERARPKTRLSLEMITRNPLRVPCLTDQYWVTFPDRSGIYLARTLRLVRERKSERLPTLDGLDRATQHKLEEDNVRRCLAAVPA